MTKPSIIISIFSFFLIMTTSVHATLIRVSQESSAGTGDFDSNILGTISTWSTTKTSYDFYKYGTNASYDGDDNGGPAAISNTAINFFVETSNGLTFYNVFDSLNSDTGAGPVEMSWSLTGDTADFMVKDDNTSDAYTNSLDTDFTTSHSWLPERTDGFGLGTLDGTDWTLYGEFDALNFINNWSWTALSVDSNSIDFNLALNQRIRFDLYKVPEPSIIALLVTGLFGIGLFQRRNHKHN